MSHPILSAVEEFQRPPQLIRLDRKINGRVGDVVKKTVEFVIHEENENGMTLRFVELQDDGDENEEKDTSNAPRTGTGNMIVPSPSA